MQTFYGILLPDNELARMEIKSNGRDRYACGENSYKLTDDPNDQEWLVENPEDVIKTIFSDIRWYNSSLLRPAWGKFKREDFRLAKITIQKEINEVELKIPPNIECVDTRDIPWVLAKRYTNIQNLPQDKKYIFCLVENKMEEMKEWIDQVVPFDAYFYIKRKIISILPVPEEFQDDKSNCLLICENT